MASGILSHFRRAKFWHPWRFCKSSGCQDFNFCLFWHKTFFLWAKSEQSGNLEITFLKLEGTTHVQLDHYHRQGQGPLQLYSLEASTLLLDFWIFTPTLSKTMQFLTLGILFWGLFWTKNHFLRHQTVLTLFLTIVWCAVIASMEAQRPLNTN